MILNREAGTYALGKVVRFYGSFKTDTTNNPDVVRDGNSNYLASVVHASTGLFTVTFESGFPIPSKLVAFRAEIASAAAPTKFCYAYVVKDSYSQATRSFQIQVMDLDTPVATDPDDGDWISFELVGAIDSVGTDAA